MKTVSEAFDRLQSMLRNRAARVFGLRGTHGHSTGAEVSDNKTIPSSQTFWAC